MVQIVIVLTMIIIVLGYALLQKKSEMSMLKGNVFEVFAIDEEMKDTLRVGLIYRYQERAAGEGTERDEHPLDFVLFVAKVIGAARGSRTKVARRVGDVGADIEEQTDEGLRIGRVIWIEESHEVSFEPVAVVHSQMVQLQAIGGYVVTIGEFTDEAKDYARRLGIELIKGKMLVELWLEGMHGIKSKVSKVLQSGTRVTTARRM